MDNQSDFLIEVYDRGRARRGQIAKEYTDLKFTEVFNSVGAWECKLPSEHPLLDVLKTKGSGLVITERWQTSAGTQTRVYSGPMRSAKLSQSAEDPAGTWTITGVHDNVIAAATLVYPDPAHAANAQTTATWNQTAAGETVMKNAVSLNIGPTAIAARKYSWLTVKPNLTRGATVSCSSRFDKLGDLLSSLGTAAGLGWRFAQNNGLVEFDVYIPQDKTKLIRLDIRNDGVTSNELGYTAPSASQVLVMGQGDGANRKILAITTSDSVTAATDWGLRWEITKDQRNTNDTTELTQAGLEILAESGTTVNTLKIEPSNAPNMQLGIDWYVGDKITAVVQGQETTALVTQVATSISDAGVIRQASIGDPTGFNFDAKIVSKINDVEQRVGKVERLVGVGTAWADIADKPAAATIDTGWVASTPVSTVNSGPQVRQIGLVVYPRGAIQFKASGTLTGTFTTVATVPASMAPAQQYLVGVGSSLPGNVQGIVLSTGEIQLRTFEVNGMAYTSSSSFSITTPWVTT